MTHAEAIETIKNGGATVRLLVKRGKAPPPAILGRHIINVSLRMNQISKWSDIGYWSWYPTGYSRSDIRSIPECVRFHALVANPWFWSPCSVGTLLFWRAKIRRRLTEMCFPLQPRACHFRTCALNSSQEHVFIVAFWRSTQCDFSSIFMASVVVVVIGSPKPPSAW